MLNPQGDVRANCRGVSPKVFYPETAIGWVEALAICDVCEIKLECREWAHEQREEFGIWGGETERTRRKTQTTSDR